MKMLTIFAIAIQAYDEGLIKQTQQVLNEKHFYKSDLENRMNTISKSLQINTTGSKKMTVLIVQAVKTKVEMINVRQNMCTAQRCACPLGSDGN